MKRIVIASLMAVIVLAVSFTTVQSASATGFIWEKICGNKSQKSDKPVHHQKPKPTIPASPAPPPPKPVPVEKPVEPTPTPAPVVITASTVKPTPAPEPAPNQVVLPQTGAADGLIRLMDIGGLAYAGAYAVNRFKR